MRHVEIDVEMYDVKMQVTGYYERGLAAVSNANIERCSPAEPSEFEIDTVHIGGVDVTELLNNLYIKGLGCALKEAENLALEAAEEAGL